MQIPYKIMQGEWWRLITPVFLHANIPHFLVSGVAVLIQTESYAVVFRLWHSAVFRVGFVVTILGLTLTKSLPLDCVHTNGVLCYGGATVRAFWVSLWLHAP